MIYNTSSDKTTFYVTLTGPINDAVGSSLADCFEEALYSNKKYVEFNFRAVPFINSRYISEIAQLARRLAMQKRDLVLRGVQDQLALLFQSQNLDQMARMED